MTKLIFHCLISNHSFPLHATPPMSLTNLCYRRTSAYTPTYDPTALRYVPSICRGKEPAVPTGTHKHARGGCRATARLSERPLPIVRLRASIVSVITATIAPPSSGRRSGFRPPIVVLNRSLAKSGKRFRIRLTCAYRLGQANEIGPTAPAKPARKMRTILNTHPGLSTC